MSTAMQRKHHTTSDDEKKAKTFTKQAERIAASISSSSPDDLLAVALLSEDRGVKALESGQAVEALHILRASVHATPFADWQTKNRRMGMCKGLNR